MEDVRRLMTDHSVSLRPDDVKTTLRNCLAGILELLDLRTGTIMTAQQPSEMECLHKGVLPSEVNVPMSENEPYLSGSKDTITTCTCGYCGRAKKFEHSPRK